MNPPPCTDLARAAAEPPPPSEPMEPAVCTLTAGGATLLIRFVAGAAGGLRTLAAATSANPPYAEVLAAAVLDPLLARWSAAGQASSGDRRDRLPADIDAAMARCLETFDAFCKRHPRDEAAILAALTVTANLQRTLTTLAESLAQPFPAEPRPPEERTLCRAWCGFPPPRDRRRASSGAPATSRPNAQAQRLGRALGCPPSVVESRCAEALDTLREELRRGTLLTPDDLASVAGAK